MSHRRRAGVTLIELLFAMAIFAVLFVMVWGVFRQGRRQVTSTHRKLDATRDTHLAFELLRHELEGTPWAWAAPVPVIDTATGQPLPPGAPPPPGTTRTLVAGGREYVFDGDSGRLTVDGQARPGEFSDVRFWNQPEFLVKLLLRKDESRPANTGMPAARERSTLVSKVFMERQAEEVRHRNHVWEAGHRWCVKGGSIHYGFTE